MENGKSCYDCELRTICKCFPKIFAFYAEYGQLVLDTRFPLGEMANVGETEDILSHVADERLRVLSFFYENCAIRKMGK